MQIPDLSVNFLLIEFNACVSSPLRLLIHSFGCFLHNMACWECAMCAIYGFAVGMVDAFLKKCNAENTVAHTRTRSMATDLSLSPFALQSLRECQQLFKFQELRLELSMNMKPICHTKHNESDDEEFWLSSPTIKHIYSWVTKRSLTLPTNTWSMH